MGFRCRSRCSCRSRHLQEVPLEIFQTSTLCQDVLLSAEDAHCVRVCKEGEKGGNGSRCMWRSAFKILQVLKNSTLPTLAFATVATGSVHVAMDPGEGGGGSGEAHPRRLFSRPSPMQGGGRVLHQAVVVGVQRGLGHALDLVLLHPLVYPEAAPQQHLVRGLHPGGLVVRHDLRHRGLGAVQPGLFLGRGVWVLPGPGGHCCRGGVAAGRCGGLIAAAVEGIGRGRGVSPLPGAGGPSGAPLSGRPCIPAGCAPCPAIMWGRVGQAMGVPVPDARKCARRIKKGGQMKKFISSKGVPDGGTYSLG